MRRFHVILLGLALGCHLAGVAWAREFKLTSGSIIYGEVSSFDENGVVFRLDSGGFSTRTSWTKFSQDALKLLAENPKIKPVVEPFIDVPLKPKPKPKSVFLKDVPRVERPAGRTSFFSSFTAPLGLAILALLYAGNLLAAYEIAVYRNRPLPVVCGVSALLPLIGPLIFLASSTLVDHTAGAPEQAALEGMPEAVGPAVAALGSPSGATSRRVGVPQAPAGGGLKVAAQAKAAAAGRAEPKVFKRGDYTFNRRFVETQFTGFFRVVPTEAEKDLVLVIRTTKNEYVGKRITRISSNEMFLQLLQQATKEVSIQFGEIAEIAIKHKDDIKE